MNKDVLFKKGQVQGNWNELDLKRAVKAVKVNHISQNHIITEEGCTHVQHPRETLSRHLKKLSNHPDSGVAKELGRKPIFILTVQQESNLSNMLQDMEARMYGLSSSDVRSFVYSFCKKKNIAASFNEDTELAGRGWFQ